MRFYDALATLRSGDTSSFENLVKCANAATDEDLAMLADCLGRSGATLAFGNSVDVASTGGPTSLSTLLPPLAIAAMGCQVRALAVPGRPAGGIDVMGTIPGYRVHLDPSEVSAVIKRSCYVHFLADRHYAPLDIALFRYRQNHAAQAVAPLAIASLVAKKVAAGVGRACLDVRVAQHGNLGRTWPEARNNAERFVRVADLLGIRATCWLTDARFPYQPWIGRGETLVALDYVLSGQADGSLQDHAQLCNRMAAATVGAIVSDIPSPSRLRETLERHLEAQGASWSAFQTRVEATRQAERHIIRVQREGTLRVDLALIRDLLVRVQADFHESGRDFCDPAGIVLLCETGRRVSEGQEVALVRAPSAVMDALVADLAPAFYLGRTAEDLEQREPELLSSNSAQS